MSKEKRIPLHLIEYIWRAALADLSKDRRALAQELRRDLKWGGKKTPKVETIMRIISTARAAFAREDNPPWSLGSCLKDEIPPDVIPTVLAVWRLCLAADKPFTRRHARWVARLCKVIEPTSLLWLRAHAYTVREQICQEKGKPVDTSDLDAALAMYPGEYATARELGRVSLSSLDKQEFIVHVPPPEGLDRETEDAVTVVELEACSALRLASDELGVIRRYASEDFLRRISPEAAWVYAYWLSCLVQGTKWGGLSQEERFELCFKLREWVREYVEPARELGSLGVALARIHEAGEIRRKVEEPPSLLPLELIPDDLLCKVGYSREVKTPRHKP